MKPPAFAYHRPTTLEDALATLGQVGADGKVLAGGQSLVPVLNMRLAAPGHLVDINRLATLAYVRTNPAEVRVGALARHADVERDDAAFARLPLLRQAVAHVAHPAIRNRGTAVGSLAHADPAAELPAVLSLVEGTVSLASAGGTVRTVAAADFFTGPLESAVRPGELAMEATFPVPAADTGSAWLEISRRRGDYAVVGTGVLVTLDSDGRVARARAAYVSVAPTPAVVDLTDAVVGQPWDATDWGSAGALAAGAVNPDDDIHATGAYRRHLVAVLTVRACRQAAAAAAGAGPAAATGEAGGE
jgi:CO/xanthine dehydrogenase FAD-binding subunit